VNSGVTVKAVDALAPESSAESVVGVDNGKFR
jgi:hypothetical protein